LQPLPVSLPANVTLPAPSPGDFGLTGDPKPSPAKADAPPSLKVEYSPLVQKGIEPSPSSFSNGVSPPAKAANAVLHNTASDLKRDSSSPLTDESNPAVAQPTASVEQPPFATVYPFESKSAPLPALGTDHRTTAPTDSAPLSAVPANLFSPSTDESGPSVPLPSASDQQAAPTTVAATASESNPLSSPVAGDRPPSSEVADDSLAAATIEKSTASVEPDNPSSDPPADTLPSETANTPPRSSTSDVTTVSQASALLLSLIESDPPSAPIPTYFAPSAPASSASSKADNARGAPEAAKLAHSLTASTILAASLAAKGISGGGKLESELMNLQARLEKQIRR
jgi:hypothetical protein